MVLCLESEKLGKDYDLVRSRLKIGMPLKRALFKTRRISWTSTIVDGKEVNIIEYCHQHQRELDVLDLGPQNIRERLRNGWDFERATTEPKKVWASERQKAYRKSKRYKK